MLTTPLARLMVSTLAALSSVCAVQGIPGPLPLPLPVPHSWSAPPSLPVPCHVCGHSDLFPGQPPPPPCSPELLPTPRACPEGYRGCITTLNGKTITRTCERSAIDSCQVANRVVYCYCTGGHCNKHGLDLLESKREAAQGGTAPADDEDDEESIDSGSGDFDNDSEGRYDGDGSYIGEDDTSTRMTATLWTTESVRAPSIDGDLFISSSSEEATSHVSVTSPAPAAPSRSGESGSGSGARGWARGQRHARWLLVAALAFSLWQA